MDEYTVEEPELEESKNKSMVKAKSPSGNNKEVSEDEFKKILEKSNKFPPGSITINYNTAGQKIYMFGGKVVFTEFVKSRDIPKDIDD